MRLFSLFYDCAPVAVSSSHHGNLLSFLFSWQHILCVLSAVQPHARTFFIWSAHMRVCVLCGHETDLQEFPLCRHLRSLLSGWRSSPHWLCQIRDGWSPAWEWGWIRQAEAVWFSFHPLPPAGAAWPPQVQQSPQVSTTSTLDLPPPFTPVTHNICAHRDVQPPDSPSEHLPLCSHREALHSSHHSFNTSLIHSESRLLRLGRTTITSPTGPAQRISWRFQCDIRKQCSRKQQVSYVRIQFSSDSEIRRVLFSSVQDKPALWNGSLESLVLSCHGVPCTHSVVVPVQTLEPPLS